MSIEFAISFDREELKYLFNVLLTIQATDDKILNRITHKLDFIIENMDRDYDNDVPESP